MTAARSIVWILLFILSAIGMLVLVPRKRIWELLAFGIVGGLGLALLVQYLAVVQFNLWSFNYLQIASWRGFPVFVAAAWFPAVIIFAHFLGHIKGTTSTFLYVIGFSLATALLEYVFVLMGYRQYVNWSFPLTAALAIGLHTLLAIYLLYIADVRKQVAERERV